jgi:hypothetical protein
MPEIKFTLTGNADDLVNALSAAQAKTSEIANDFDAISTGMNGVLDRAREITDFFKQNVELVNNMKEVLNMIGAINQANASSLQTNLQAIREMVTQVTRHGGTIGDAQKLIGAASSTYGGGAAGNFAQNMGAVAERQAHIFDSNSDIRAGNQAPLGVLAAIQKAASSKGTEAEGHLGTEPHAVEAKAGPTPVSHTGGLGGSIPVAKPRYVPDDRGAVDLDTLRASLFSRPAAKYNLNTNFASIAKRYGFKPGKEEYASLDAYDQGTRYIDKMLGTSGFGGTLGGMLKKGMYGDRNSLIAAIREVQNDPNSEDRWSRIYGGVGEDGIMPKKGTSDYLIAQTLERFNKTLERVDKINSTPLLGGKVPGLSNIGEAAGTIGTGYNIYQLLAQLAGGARVLTGYAQNQGQGYGTVNYTRSAGNFMDAAMQSWGGLNPFYSFGNAQQAQNTGIGMGYRGGLLTQYENAAYGLQTQNGMTQQQTAQAVSALQQVGMSPAQTAAMIASVRNTAGSSSSQYYNAGAATTAAVAAQGSFMSWGGTTAASGTAGKIAGKFAGPNSILANTGLTGQDLMNSSFGMAMMSQQLGISFNNMYAYRQNAMSTTSGTNAYIDLYSKDLVKYLSNSIGMNLMNVTSSGQLNPYAMTLMYTLQGFGINITGPQEAVAYTYAMIQQGKGKFNTTSGTTAGGAPAGRAAGYAGASYYANHPQAVRDGGSMTSTVPSPASSSTGSSGGASPGMVMPPSEAGPGMGGSSGGTVTLVHEHTFKPPFLNNMMSVVTTQQQNTTNGTIAPQTTPNRAAVRG